MESGSKSRQLKGFENLVSLASFTFWIATFTTLITLVTLNGWLITELCLSVTVGLVAAVWVLGVHILQFAKLTDYNIWTSWIIAILIMGSYMIVLPIMLTHVLMTLSVAWVLAYSIPILFRKIDKYIQ